MNDRIPGRQMLRSVRVVMRVMLECFAASERDDAIFSSVRIRTAEVREVLIWLDGR